MLKTILIKLIIKFTKGMARTKKMTGTTHPGCKKPKIMTKSVRLWFVRPVRSWTYLELTCALTIPDTLYIEHFSTYLYPKFNKFDCFRDPSPEAPRSAAVRDSQIYLQLVLSPSGAIWWIL